MRVIPWAIVFAIAAPLMASAAVLPENIPGFDKSSILTVIQSKLFDFDAVLHRGEKNYVPPKKITIESPDWKIIGFQNLNFDSSRAKVGSLILVFGNVSFQKIVGEKKGEEEYFDFSQLYGLLPNGERKVFYENIDMSSCDTAKLQSAALFPVNATGMADITWAVAHLIETETSDCPGGQESDQSGIVFIIDGSNPLKKVYEKRYEVFHGRVLTKKEDPEHFAGHEYRTTFLDVSSPYNSDATKLDVTTITRTENAKLKLKKISIQFDKERGEFR